MQINNIIFKINNLFLYLYYLLFIRNNNTIKNQRENPLSIPIIIINYNQLYYLKKQVEFYIKRRFEKIIIIDNASTFPPLLDYYKQIQNKVTIEYMDENKGHMVFFQNKTLQKKYGKGYYVISDPDIIPNKNLPENFMSILIKKLDLYFRAANKIGFALNIDDIPDYYPLKENVIKWESQFWKHQFEKNIYKADIDTTFALYKPFYPSIFQNLKFVSGFRIAGDFTAKHGGWYIDKDNMTEENKYYFEHCNSSSSWKFTESGDLTNELKNIY
ncbi:glycosyltransferase family 2 protein [Elizabethkingia sp. JS20170427COW]|uniref:glycosyltransferase family 2 protein n=1 Tax=Elizabethkingia sp. JS20170427COW TaxID=2583851 RepID=UPI00111076C3|nr:glycosyltransferase family 2 protein [Elizabethkingia sp. JS20170427COW]QCX53433.1 glycosyltransferase family 2 protein [Elizabethkingia sp. JS20170427COW]